jgi:putative transposase
MELQISHSFRSEIQKKSFYGEHKEAIEQILRKLCEWKGVNIVEAEVCPVHIRLLGELPPKYSVSGFMGYLKGKSATILYEQFGELKYKYRNREFWCKGYYVDTVRKNEARIAEYIKKQLEEDQFGARLTIGGEGPFKSNKKK